MIRTSRNISLLSAGTLIGALGQLAAQALLARHLGSEQYGTFAAALASIAILVPLAGFGSPRVIQKVFGEEGQHAVRWIPSVLRYVLVTTLIALLLLVAYAMSLAESAERSLLVLLPILPCFAMTELAIVECQLEERYAHLTGWQMAQPIGRLVASLVFVFVFTRTDASAVNAACSFSVVAVGLLASAQLRGGGKFHNIRVVGHDPKKSAPTSKAIGVGEVARLAWPFGVDAMLFLVHLQGGVVVLNSMSARSEVGVFSVALTILTGFYLVPGLIYQRFLSARIFRWVHHDRARLGKIHRLGLLLMLIAGSVLAGVLLFVKDEAIIWLLGQSYQDAGGVLAILAACIPLRYVSSGIGALMIIGGLPLAKAMVVAFAATTNVVVTACLCPRFGAIGAACGVLLSEAILLVGNFECVRRSGILHEGGERVDA